MTVLNRYLILNSQGMGRAVKRLRGELKPDERVFPLKVTVPNSEFGPTINVELPAASPVVTNVG